MHLGKLSNVWKKKSKFCLQYFSLYRVVHSFSSFRESADRGKGKIEILSSLRYFPLYKVIHPPFNFSSSFAKTSRKMYHGKLSNLTFEKKNRNFVFPIFLYIELPIQFLPLILRREFCENLCRKMDLENSFALLSIKNFYSRLHLSCNEISIIRFALLRILRNFFKGMQILMLIFLLILPHVELPVHFLSFLENLQKDVSSWRSFRAIPT